MTWFSKIVYSGALGTYSILAILLIPLICTSKRSTDMSKLKQAMQDHAKVKLSGKNLIMNPDEAFVFMGTSQSFLDANPHLDIVKEP